MFDTLHFRYCLDFRRREIVLHSSLLLYTILNKNTFWKIRLEVLILQAREFEDFLKVQYALRTGDTVLTELPE